jgi:ABC-2 type transport system permease protein
MKFLDITLKDLYQIFTDWQPAVFLVAAPIIFTLMFGLMFGGFSGPGGNEGDDRLPVWIVEEEQTTISNNFISFLEDSDVIRIENQTSDLTKTELKTAVREEDTTAVVLLTKGFSQALREVGRAQLDVILDENNAAGVTAQQAIQTAVNRLETAAETARLVVEIYAEKEGSLSAQKSEALYDEAFTEALDAWLSPPVTALETQTQPQNITGTSEENAFAQSLPGMMAQFAIAGLIGAAEIIVQERKSGALSRLLGTAVSKFTILAGHWLAMFSMIFLQFIILVSFGQIFLRLNFFASPLATLVLSLASCAFVASLGLLIGILAKMPEQTAILALIPMFVFAGLGGAWVPIDMLGESVQFISKFTPVSWIMTGFKDILLRGAGINDVFLNVLILAGFSLLFFIPAAVLFYRKRT